MVTTNHIDRGGSRLGRIPCLALLALVLGASAAREAVAACSAPCLAAARGERRDCASSAGGVFLDRLDGCLELDLVCRDACRTAQRDCRDATDLGAARDDCSLETAVAKQDCSDSFPIGSKRWKRCVDRAQAKGFRCRRGAARDRRRALRSCRRDFKDCTAVCGPGTPPGGREQCRQDAKDELAARLAACTSDFRLSVSACIDRDPVCVQSCRDARDLCRAPVAGALQMALAACKAARDAAVDQCRIDNPGGGTALDQCIQSAQATAFACADAALGAANPGVVACTSAWAACVAACPAP